jgi:hypothetical protein
MNLQRNTSSGTKDKMSTIATVASVISGRLDWATHDVIQS